MRNKIILMLLFIGSYAMTQEFKGRPKVEEMQQLKWKMIVEEAKLTPKEIESVQPVFTDYEKSFWSIHQQKRCFFKNEQKNDGNDKINYSQVNEQYVELELKEAELFKKYHAQLKKILSPQSLYLYYKAEREFKRKLLEDMRGKMHRPERLPE